MTRGVGSSATPERVSPFDESYFVGGLRSNYIDYNESEEAIDVGFMPVVRRYARRVGADRIPRSYLDIGCAFGFYVERLARAGWDATGVDVSEYAIARGKARGVDHLHVAPAQALPFPDDSFDFVTAIDVIEHIPADEAPTAVAETWRVLRDGGLAFFATPNFISNTRWNVNTPGFTDPDVTHINYQSVESFRRLFAGFSTCRILGHTPFVDQFHVFEGSGALTRSLFRIPGARVLARQVAACDSLGRPGVTTAFSGASAALNVCVALLLIPRYGAMGAAIAVLVNSVIMVPWFLIHVHRRVLSASMTDLLRGALLRPAVATLVIVVPAQMLAQRVHSVASLLLALGATGVLYLVVTGAVGAYDAADRALLAVRWHGRETAEASQGV